LALKLGPVTEVAVVDRMSLIFVIIFSSLVLGEVFNFKIAAGIILIFLGSLLIVLK
jgi:transporter family protein